MSEASEPKISWGKVARHLADNAEEVRKRSESSELPLDELPRKLMRSEARMLDAFAAAIWAGLE